MTTYYTDNTAPYYYGTPPTSAAPVPTYSTPWRDPLDDITDDVLIFELIKRGYAVGRLNDKNQLDV